MEKRSNNKNHYYYYYYLLLLLLLTLKKKNHVGKPLSPTSTKGSRLGEAGQSDPGQRVEVITHFVVGRLQPLVMADHLT